MRLVLATRSVHKQREFARLLPGHEVVLLAKDVELPPETEESFAENATAKARVAAAATSEAAIADDSGIEAAALGGRPGVRSARFAGTGASDAENLAKLRGEVPVGTALAYTCALAFVDGQQGREQLFEGRCEGTMASEPRGERGFGYDPVFVPGDADGTRTMAELADDEKDAISHRGRAARALLEWLER